MKKFLAMLLAVIMLLGLFAGCNQTADPTDAPTDAPTNAPTNAPTDAPDEPEDPTDAPAAEPNYLRLEHGLVNQTKSAFQPFFTAYNNMTVYLIWETLLGYDAASGEFVNVLADSYEMSADGLTHTVTLKDDATWHDGEPVVAEDVAFTFATHVKAAGSMSSQLAALKGYQAVIDGTADRIEGIVVKDDKTVVFEFDTPNFLFQETLATLGASILPSHCFEGLTADKVLTDGYWVKPIGSGAYKVNEVAWPNYCTLTANENWHMGTPGVKDILLTVYADNAAAIADAAAGNLHIIRGLSEADATTITGTNSNMTTNVIDSGYTRMFVINQHETGRPEMRDANVRKAISMIIDKQMIVDYVGIQASVATTMTALEFNTDIPVWTRDVEGGKKLLEDAGFDFTKPLRLYTNYTDQQTIDIMDILVANFAEAGITAEYTTGGDDVVAAIYEIRDYDIYYGGGSGLHVNMFNCWTVGQLYDAWYYEDIKEYRTARYQDMINKYKATADAAERTEILDQIQVNSVEDMYLIPVWHRNTIWAVDKAVSGFECWATDYDTMVYPDMTAWSIAG